MNAWKVIVSTLVIFIAGVVTGGLLVTHSFRVLGGNREVRQPNLNATVNINTNNRPLAGNPGGMGMATPWQFRNKELLRRMDRELELTPDQHTNIEHIMISSAERTKNLWKPIAGLMAKETQIVHAEIRAELTPDQAKKFDGFGKGRSNFDKHRGTNSVPGEPATTNPTAPSAIGDIKN